MPCVSVSPGRDSRTRTRSRLPSRSLSTSVWTNRVSSTASASANWGWLAPFSTFSHGGGVGRSRPRSALAGAVTSTAANGTAATMSRDNRRDSRMETSGSAGRRRVILSTRHRQFRAREAVNGIGKASELV
jgi:hypothetical protein